VAAPVSELGIDLQPTVSLGALFRASTFTSSGIIARTYLFLGLAVDSGNLASERRCGGHYKSPPRLSLSFVGRCVPWPCSDHRLQNQAHLRASIAHTRCPHFLLKPQPPTLNPCQLMSMLESH
jgi:hypothetical protein